jgi:hypothetical protein
MNDLSGRSRSGAEVFDNCGITDMVDKRGFADMVDERGFAAKHLLGADRRKSNE